MIHFLFLDLDDTILDFQKAEHVALGKTLESFQIRPTGEIRELYSRINREYWQRLERGELTRAQVLVGRFAELFERVGVSADPQLCANRYTHNLGIGHWFLPGAREALEVLAPRYALYLTSNGTASVQRGRLESADISHFFRDIFISQDIGVNKPDREYFTRCFARILDFDPRQAMIVGDSLSSDILGGKNAGITTCWVNPTGASCGAGPVPDWQIPTLAQLPALLETL